MPNRKKTRAPAGSVGPTAKRVETTKSGADAGPVDRAKAAVRAVLGADLDRDPLAWIRRENPVAARRLASVAAMQAHVWLSAERDMFAVADLNARAWTSARDSITSAAGLSARVWRDLGNLIDPELGRPGSIPGGLTAEAEIFEGELGRGGGFTDPVPD